MAWYGFHVWVVYMVSVILPFCCVWVCVRERLEVPLSLSLMCDTRVFSICGLFLQVVLVV